MAIMAEANHRKESSLEMRLVASFCVTPVMPQNTRAMVANHNHAGGKVIESSTTCSTDKSQLKPTRSRLSGHCLIFRASVSLPTRRSPEETEPSPGKQSKPFRPGITHERKRYCRCLRGCRSEMPTRCQYVFLRRGQRFLASATPAEPTATARS